MSTPDLYNDLESDLNTIPELTPYQIREAFNTNLVTCIVLAFLCVPVVVGYLYYNLLIKQLEQVKRCRDNRKARALKAEIFEEWCGSNPCCYPFAPECRSKSY